MVHIRKIKEFECETLLAMMQKRYAEKNRPLQRTAEGLRKQIFESHTLQAYVVDMGTQLGGYCLYLQEACADFDGDGYRVIDTYLQENLRHGGLGKAFLQTLGMISQDEGKSFLCWDMPDCREKDTAFFTEMGAKLQGESRLFIVVGKDIEYFAAHCSCHKK